MSYRFVAQLAALSVASTLTQCHKAPKPTTSTSSSATSSARAPSPSANGGASAIPTDEPATVEMGLGQWIVTSPYRFRLTRVERCRGAAPGTTPPPAGKSVRLGFVVEIQSKYDGFLAHPRDITLQKKGVIYSSEPNGAGCNGTGLGATMMKHDETVRGVVTFQLPDEDDARSAKIVYEPTRWGGAPRAEAKIPECLDACAPNVASATGAHNAHKAPH